MDVMNQLEVPRATDHPQKQDVKAAKNNNFTQAVQISAQSQRMVSEQLASDYNKFPMVSFRLRYQLLDLAYYMENSEHLKETNASRIITTLYKEMELPILQPNIDAALGSLVKLYLVTDPMFQAVNDDTSDEAAQAAAKQMDAIISENSRMTGWKRQFTIWLKNSLKYNISGIEVDWIVRKGFHFKTDPQQSLTQATVSNVLRAGNEVMSLPMYNTFFDTSVSPADVHSKGDYAGYVEKISFTKLHQWVADQLAAGKTLMNVEADGKLWRSSTYHNWHIVPKMIKDIVLNSSTDWVSYFTADAIPMQGNSREYEKVTYYRRIIPAMFKITGIPDGNNVQVWKFVEINGVLVLAERRTNAHNYLPTVFCQPVEDDHGTQTKGLGSLLLPFQNLTGTMWRARISSLARAISDRLLYDPTRISEKNINSQLPTAKIPVRPGAYGSKISDAVQLLPYDDRNAQMLHQDIGAVQRWSEDAAHINKAERGQFTKGNRTLGEYSDIQNNAFASQMVMALVIEHQAMTPIKAMIKINILQYQTNTTLTAPNTNKSVVIAPDKLRDAIIEFQLADGLINKDQMMGYSEIIETFQVLSQDPEARARYDIVKMMVDTLASRGSPIKMYAYQQTADADGNQVPNRAVPSMPV